MIRVLSLAAFLATMAAAVQPANAALLGYVVEAHSSKLVQFVDSRGDPSAQQGQKKAKPKKMREFVTEPRHAPGAGSSQHRAGACPEGPPCPDISDGDGDSGSSGSGKR